MPRPTPAEPHWRETEVAASDQPIGRAIENEAALGISAGDASRGGGLERANDRACTKAVPTPSVLPIFNKPTPSL